eukprot:CAMPEP_0168810206 /NCGR_PEP_ID=MMETSP0726-20121227/3483_1 /TAXON_ID=265536 /ORGANISM="Amphiprora sp., Strain CCMP467" /LENGTH=250 /DNA_ID=CAMNT_0008862217 /DNA_START=68 /DNA_END=817 /DNA_ORIENTATION=+
MNSYHTDSSSGFLERLLQQSGDGNPNGGTSTPPTEEFNPSQFLYFAGFLGVMISLFFVSSCCCTSSRNNSTTVAPSQGPRSASGTTSRVQELPPKADFENLLSKTTMKVTKRDLLHREDSQKITGDSSAGFGIDGTSIVMFDVELGETSTSSSRNQFRASAKSNRSSFDLGEDSSRVLKLPSDQPNGDRLVHGTCAICLSSFKKGEGVSWSASPKCSHAYHTSCIVSYADTATKKTHDHSIPCPLCREIF